MTGRGGGRVLQPSAHRSEVSGSRTSFARRQKPGIRGKMSDVNRARVRHVRIGVVCANGPMARALAQLLETQLDMEVVGVAATCADGVRLVQQISPEVSVVDYGLPDGDAATMTSVIRGKVSDVATLVLGSAERPEAVVAVAAAGASGWLPKSSLMQTSEGSAPSTAGPDLASIEVRSSASHHHSST